MKSQKGNQNEKSKSTLGKVFDFISSPKVVGGFKCAESGYKCLEVYNAYQKNETDNFIQNKAIDYVSNEAVTTIFSGIGSLIPALGSGFLPVVGIAACSFLIAYGLKKI